MCDDINSIAMKRTIIVAVALLCVAFCANAQDATTVVNQATDLYNSGASALSTGDNATALKCFEQALQLAQGAGEAGNEIAENCNSVIPQLHIRSAKDLLKAGKFDDAIAALYKIVEKFKGQDVAAEAESMIPQAYMLKGNKLTVAKNYTEAAEAFKKVLEINPSNGKAMLLLGQTYDKAGDSAAAEQAYIKAIGLGQEKTAKKQLGTIFVKQALAALQGKDNTAALAAAEKAMTYTEIDKAYRIGGQAAIGLGDNAKALKYFEKYIEMSPAAGDAVQIRDAIEALKKQAEGK